MLTLIEELHRNRKLNYVLHATPTLSEQRWKLLCVAWKP